MPLLRIKHLISDLKQEISESVPPEDQTRNRLDSIVSEMEAEVATESQLAVLPAKVTDWVKEYEATHPKVTRILIDIATTLSNMGI